MAERVAWRKQQEEAEEAAQGGDQVRAAVHFKNHVGWMHARPLLALSAYVG
jgi:hypothetical protein